MKIILQIPFVKVTLGNSYFLNVTRQEHFGDTVLPAWIISMC